nr:hypothetical protein Iba_chr02dCG5350 [Ipomoea batatas]
MDKGELEKQLPYAGDAAYGDQSREKAQPPKRYSDLSGCRLGRWARDKLLSSLEPSVVTVVDDAIADCNNGRNVGRSAPTLETAMDEEHQMSSEHIIGKSTMSDGVGTTVSTLGAVICSVFNRLGWKFISGALVCSFVSLSSFEKASTIGTELVISSPSTKGLFGFPGDRGFSTGDALLSWISWNGTWEIGAGSMTMVAGSPMYVGAGELLVPSHCEIPLRGSVMQIILCFVAVCLDVSQSVTVVTPDSSTVLKVML